MIQLIDRYIAKLFLAYFFSAIVVVVTLYVAVHAMSELLNLKPTPTQMLEYYLYSAPSIVYQMIPIASLVATVFTLGGLNKSNELTALFSVGMSLARISGPILLLVALISVGSFWLGDRILPVFNQKKNYIYYVEIKKQPGLYSTVKTNKIWYRSENIIFNLRTFFPDQNRAQDATFYYFDEAWNLLQMVSANEVHVQGDKWTLYNGTVTLFEESSFPHTQSFKSKTIPLLDDVNQIQESASSSDVQSIAQLRRFIKKNKDAGLETMGYEVDYHAKFGFAFSAFVMAFLGVPFSSRPQRSGGRFLQIGLCIGLAFVYWALYSSGITLGRHGVLMPFFAAWLPNILTVGATFFLLLHLRK